ncbi:MAG: hypothetical protein UX87_C0051G0007 [Candidatus Amesbacteria bacterium GW2011_GWA1_47_16]|uniref:Uncharacterized protein n=1 Tax=Candidatus Amesbacteria bacterium GW2011_GWA1_47_16 TaxID=1618353 RepID=A0A0G1UX78_9BACT|nr:MAG: hypothetical protein UX87_C0051G0007 [Candidatus Amesbacteria bacterium GW2011_GWA1_47_16]
MLFGTRAVYFISIKKAITLGMHLSNQAAHVTLVNTPAPVAI